MTKRGWFVVRAVIIALAMADGGASLWLHRTLENDRPHHVQGAFIEPYATLNGSVFVSQTDRILQMGLLVVGVMLIVAYLSVVRASTGRSPLTRLNT